MRVELVTLAVTVLALAALGVAAGLVWSAVAPVSTFVLTDSGPHLADPESQTLIAADGWFAVITGVLGLTSGAAAYFLTHRRAPVGAVLGVTGGGLLGAYIAFQVGSATAGTMIQAAPPGGLRTTESLGLTAHGVLLIWALLAAAIFWVLEFVLSYREASD
ncbi:hypothetical protein [Microtetraspora sp. NBRC 16547]|uniref:hypothetical protein n=1 Tax=Microtetraspora sp. NBRC 16547 TaxID=3030993 RepID=UPI0024A50B12|nr:hypothetical protein [Microtetraspora sp. NBRC 16547]GLW97332.1 hypothetical protein Misp02_14190 [Microtetraspora sp. NBRC 16547]